MDAAVRRRVASRAPGAYSLCVAPGPASSIRDRDALEPTPPWRQRWQDRRVAPMDSHKLYRFADTPSRASSAAHRRVGTPPHQANARCYRATREAADRTGNCGQRCRLRIRPLLVCQKSTVMPSPKPVIRTPITRSGPNRSSTVSA